MKRPASSVKLGISLFPFLDALICMMGGLIVILAAVNHSAAQQAVLKHSAERNAQAAAITASPAADPEPVVDDTAVKALEALSETRDELAWRIEHLRSSREKTAQDLHFERLRLSSAESQVTQLKQQLAELSGALQQIQGTSAQQNQSRVQLAQTLEATRQQLEAAKQRVARAQLDAANRKPSYAVVPYEGPNRTKRRPIYIECTAEKIIIQPEGIIVLPSDLAGPPGPGYPLASTIRAIREGLLATSPDPSSPDAEPYPLFLVRPNGIVAYYEAREAMASWAHEIGYQVVEQDWPLTFPPADPNLALRANQTLADARQRFEWLAKQNPELAKRASTAPKTYRVSPTGGGLIAEGGPGGSGGASLPSWSESQGRGGGSPGTGGGFDNSAQASNSGRYSDSTDVPNGGANSLAGLNPSTRIGSSYSGGGGGMSSTAGTGQYQTGGLGNSQYAPGAAPTGIYGNLNPVMDAGGFGSGNGTGSSGGGMSGQGQSTANGQGSAMQNASMSGGPMNGNGTGSNGQGSQGQGSAGQASAGQPGGAYGMQGSSSGGSSVQGGGSQGGGAQGSGSQGGSSQQFGSLGSGQPSGGSMNTGMANAAGPGAAPTTRQYGDLNQKQPMPSDGVPSDTPAPINTPTPKREPAKSLASTKGKDWAVMRNGNGTSPITRPVRLRVNGGQLVLLADATANEGEQVIPIYGDTGQAIPGLVQSVEKRIDKWGLAGKGLYWSPELVFEVTPDGEGRYADLQTLLDNSGWIVRRKQ